MAFDRFTPVVNGALSRLPFAGAPCGHPADVPLWAENRGSANLASVAPAMRSPPLTGDPVRAIGEYYGAKLGVLNRSLRPQFEPQDQVPSRILGSRTTAMAIGASTGRMRSYPQGE